MNYAKATVGEMRAALESGSSSAVSLLAEARRVIQEKNGTINAFIEVFSSADADAERADERRAGGKAGPLTGIPIAVKDNICIQGEAVTAGSRILSGFVAPYSATVIDRLRAEGAVIVGRTNMDEFAMGSSTEHSAHGATRNPHDTERVAGGSSGGSAAAVAMGAVPLALGSDTGGSIRQPASFCGVVGLKPTYGSVSRHGLIALGSSLDVIGVLARNAEDAETLFTAISGAEDGYDSTAGLFGESRKTGAPADRTIGVPDTLETMGISREARSAFTASVDRLAGQGYTVRPVSLPIMERAGSIYYILQPAEASSNLARFDGVRYGLHEDGDDFREEYLRTRGAGFGDEVKRRIVIGTHVLSAGYYDAYYRKATAARDMMRSQFSDALREVAVLMLPTTPDVAFRLGSIQDPVAMYAEDRLTLQASLTGLPALSVPATTDGLPLGTQIISGAGEESALFRCARDLAVAS